MTTHLLAPDGGAVCGLAPVDADVLGETFEIRKPGGGGPACRHCLERLRLQRERESALEEIRRSSPRDDALHRDRARRRLERIQRQRAALEATPRPFFRVRTESGWVAYWPDGRVESA